MNYFSDKEKCNKIQAVLDLFHEFFPFKINGKYLETLLFQGGMGVDVSTIVLALACAMIGMAGTIATSMSKYLDLVENLVLDGMDVILGINNMVSLVDYEENYKLGESIKVDYIASGAGISKAVVKRIQNQITHLNSPYHFWTIPIVSNVDQLPNRIKTNAGIIIIENDDAGGHNGIGVDFRKTLEKFKKAKIDAKGNKIVSAGGIRTPFDFVLVLDAGFDAGQIATILLPSEKANIDDFFRRLVVHAKVGDVDNIVSPAGFAASGFINHGIMPRILKGISLPKLSCANSREHGCLADCNHIKNSAEAAGINPNSVGDYCIWKALLNLHNDNRKNKNSLFFCGKRPEDFFLKKYMQENNILSLPVKEIIGRFLEGVFNEIICGNGFDGITGKLNDGHRKFLEKRFKYYQKNPDIKLSGKIFQG